MDEKKKKEPKPVVTRSFQLRQRLNKPKIRTCRLPRGLCRAAGIHYPTMTRDGRRSF